QLAGAVKNVLAIAAGIAEGMQLGLNARAALICRGLSEMTRLGIKMGGVPETFSGMAGLGDLVLTGTGSLSRNHTLGLRIGEGLSPEEIFQNQLTVTEGAATSVSLQSLSRHHQVEMPICEAVYRILYQGQAPMEALTQLLERQMPESESINWGQNNLS
ncbi:MAG: glycerol-3-phosphate dehydrogenase, partial [Deltaproteobacteria bacterium]